MIYSQQPIFYVLTLICAVFGFLRCQKYLLNFFTESMAWAVSFLVFTHPLSIDMFVAPNLIPAPLAFSVFIEALLMEKKEKYISTILLSALSALFNISFFFFPLYFIWKHRAQLKSLFFPGLIYLFFGVIYLYKHLLIPFHNPLKFLSYFTLNLISPFSLSVFDFSFFPWSWLALSVLIFSFAFFLLRQKKETATKELWPYLLMFLCGINLQQWFEPYRFWHTVIFTPSNFICLTFVLLVFIAFHVPQKIVLPYFILCLFVSIDWGMSWNPYSNVLGRSLEELPDSFTETMNAKRVYAWEKLYEDKSLEGEKIIKELIKRNPKAEELKSDLELLKNLKHNTRPINK